MKYLKLFENFKDIDSLCEEYGIENYTINNDGEVDVDGDVYLYDKELENIPIRFGVVDGYFECSLNKLSSLKGCPKVVGGEFECSNNHLSSLVGCPKEVGGYFKCYKNKLRSLEGCSEKISGYFDCSFNQLTSLKGCPKDVGGGFYCSYNKLKVIDYLPERIVGDIYFNNNRIRDIKVEDKNYRFYGKCDLSRNPINDLFQYWHGNLNNFIIELEFEDFIRDGGKSVDILRFEYALNGKEYKEEGIKNYKLIWKE